MPTHPIRCVLVVLAWVVLASPPARAESAESAESVESAEPAATPADAGASPSAGAARPLGLWILAEGSQRVLEHPERIPTLVADARALGATDLFVQVYRRGVSWWPSRLADMAESFLASRIESTAEDPLATLVAAAHAEGLRVHAWINLLSLADNSDAAIVRALGPDVLQVDRRGRSILAYPEREMPEPEAPYLRMGTPAVWIDPAAPGVAGWYRVLVEELFDRYPRLDGLHLDYVRYPDVLPFSPGSRFGVGMDFGYGEGSRRRFEAATGRVAPFGDRLEHASEWDDWRRGELTALVAEIREALGRVAPGASLSAAVFAWSSRAYLSLYQDWLGWLEAELLEFAVPMLYTRDDRLLRYQAAAFAGGVAHERVWTGLGVWLFRAEPERAVAQLRAVDRLGVSGRALFSWDAIAEAPGLREALAGEASRVAER